jgi:hypothetical protein
MIIDSHHHFWRYSPAEYGWIDDGMAAIRRDFLPADLRREMAVAGVDAVVSVQARQSLEETRWLLALAAQNPFIAGVVGWVPLVSPSVATTLAELAAQSKLVAVRHVLQDEPDSQFMLRADFQAGIRALQAFDLTYDVLIYDRHLPQAIELVDRHPSQRAQGSIAPCLIEGLERSSPGRAGCASWRGGRMSPASCPDWSPNLAVPTGPAPSCAPMSMSCSTRLGPTACCLAATGRFAWSFAAMRAGWPL